MFGTRITEKVGNQQMLSFPPHLASASALPEIMQYFRNSIISLKCCITCVASFKESPLDFFKLVDSQLILMLLYDTLNRAALSNGPAGPGPRAPKPHGAPKQPIR